MRLSDVAEVQIGFPFRGRVVHDPAGGVLVVQMKDIGDDGRLRVEDAIRVNLPSAGRRHLLRRGDLLFRSRGRSNTAAVFDDQAERAVLAAPLILIRPRRGVTPAYLAWFLNSPPTQAALARLASGTSVQVINAESVKDLEIPLPSIERQEAIAHVAALASRERELENRIAELRRRAIEARLMRHAKDSRRIPG